MLEYFVMMLLLFQFKHYYIDFVDQTMEEVNGKGIYGDWFGLRHSLKHAVATLICVLILVDLDYFVFAVVLALIDFITHYHIDWLKMNYGNRDIQNPRFWNHLGLDQMAHQVVYILLAYFVVA